MQIWIEMTPEEHERYKAHPAIENEMLMHINLIKDVVKQYANIPVYYRFFVRKMLKVRGQ